MVAERPPNILLVVSDQERQRSWIPPGVELRWRDRLRSEGLELTHFWSHSSPCSPSRATMMTGRYLPRHGVADNVIHRWHTELAPAVPTVGRLLAEHAGYRSSYIGKWHLSYGASPDMVSYGYCDWEGNDRHFMGWAGTGVHFDPVIASNAAHWLHRHAGSSEPWFLTVALVNPHDVMWYPIDQPDWQAAHAEETDLARRFLASARWRDDETIPPFTAPYDEVFEDLPPNFEDDLHTKPEAHRRWRHAQQHGVWGYIDPADKRAWLRQLDYYLKLHRLADESLGVVLGALDESGAAGRTAVIFTSDHGDMCGSHGLRSKGPFVYNEILNVPFYVRVPGRALPGTVSTSLASSVDLAPTICGLAGVGAAAQAAAGLQGVDLAPLFADPAASVRRHVLFAMASAHTVHVQGSRFALRGMFDGRYKYARYYGVGGGLPNDDPAVVFGTGTPPDPEAAMTYGPSSPFDDQDHELYDLREDPYELENLATGRGRRSEVRERFEALLELERTELA